MRRWLLAAALAVAAMSPVDALAAARTVNIRVTDDGFVPAAVIAMVDQPIHLHVVNRGSRTHQFSIPFYRIFSRNLPPGEATDIEFSPWTTGRYEMVSDPSGNFTPEFTGWFIVSDQK
ncbi:cupredoxin domain-containing protein [Alicyclobacillus sp.]|uniref:cupredoxin domain-containing protein n=1 Tax=Alicyclobacillus sp. TaxID=61169 RepID=UPI0025B929A7|nr:cupredoxin domain-containing protein [Alicyclobacillus sp.]MCL6517611.1 cupredoxin domain-containing protein [Alicyclobacillus sp.]